MFEFKSIRIVSIDVKLPDLKELRVTLKNENIKLFKNLLKNWIPYKISNKLSFEVDESLKKKWFKFDIVANDIFKAVRVLDRTVDIRNVRFNYRTFVKMIVNFAHLQNIIIIKWDFIKEEWKDIKINKNIRFKIESLIISNLNSYYIEDFEQLLWTFRLSGLTKSLKTFKGYNAFENCRSSKTARKLFKSNFFNLDKVKVDK